jgi:hypothetical protein
MVLVSALGAARGLPNMAHDSAAKAHVLSLGEALNHELRPAEVKDHGHDARQRRYVGHRRFGTTFRCRRYR